MPGSYLKKRFQKTKMEQEITDNSADKNQFSPLVQMMLEQTKKDDLYYQLLKMMYLDDVDAEYVENYLGISTDELKTVVDELVFLGFLKHTSDDEVELTEEAIEYVTHQDMKSHF